MERLSGRVVARIVGFAVLAMLALPLSTAKTSRELAAERYRRAVVLLDDLHAVPKLELGVKQYGLVADAFRSVHRASPASGYCDDALLAAAGVYAEMVSRFGPDPHRDRAIETYRFLIHEYHYSKLLDEARLAVKRLESGERIAPTAVDPEASEEADPVPAAPSKGSPPSLILFPPSPKPRPSPRPPIPSSSRPPIATNPALHPRSPPRSKGRSNARPPPAAPRSWPSTSLDSGGIPITCESSS